MKYLFLVVALAFVFNTNAQSGISSEKLKSHNYFLASDSLKGRKPGTPESKIAAEYIRNQLKSYGLTLLGDEGFQYFNIITNIKYGQDNYLKIDKFSAKNEEDNTPFPFSGNGELKAKVVFVGFGFNINDDNLKWNDFEGVDVKDKWVLILRGSPNNNRHGEFGAYESIRSKVMNAKKYGAKGVLMVSGENFDAGDNLVKMKYTSGLVRTEIPVINIKRALADKILIKSKKNINDLEKDITEKKEANSFVTRSTVSAKVNLEYVDYPTQNIVAELKSDDKEFGNQYIVIGAHYDHLGFGGKGSGSRRSDTIAVHNGADDNASGVASMLVLAKEFANCKTKPKRSIIFVAFGAEELGLIGSKYFVENPLVDVKNILAMLNLDMVGRLIDNGKNLTIIGTGTAKEFEEILDKHKEKFAYQTSYSKSGYGGSDHSSFYAKDIPVLFFHTGTEDEYHTPFDDSDLIDYKGQADVTKLVYDIAIEFANREKNLTYQNTGSNNSKRMSFKVTLGIMPSYADSGNKGLKVDGVSKDGVAEKTGVIKNDIIVEFDGTKIANIYDYMEVLKRLKPGQKTTVKVKRKDGIKELDVQF